MAYRYPRDTMYRYLSVYKVIHSGFTKYPLLVFTKSVISNFRAFLLAPVTQIILGYLLFLVGSQNGASFCDIASEDEILALNEVTVARKLRNLAFVTEFATV